MSHSDKILKLLKETPALSATAIWKKQQENGETETLRSVQRHLKTLHEEGLIEAHAVGREVLYSLAKSEGHTSTDYFTQRCWNELFTVQKEIATAKPDDMRKAYVRLRSLVMLLPEQAKKGLLPDIKNIDKRLDEEARFGYDGFFAETLRYDEALRMVENFRLELQGLAEKLASQLHALGKRKNEKKE